MGRMGKNFVGVARRQASGQVAPLEQMRTRGEGFSGLNHRPTGSPESVWGGVVAAARPPTPPFSD